VKLGPTFFIPNFQIGSFGAVSLEPAWPPCMPAPNTRNCAHSSHIHVAALLEHSSGPVCWASKG
jgi:hypothetical protein